MELLFKIVGYSFLLYLISGIAVSVYYLWNEGDDLWEMYQVEEKELDKFDEFPPKPLGIAGFVIFMFFYSLLIWPQIVREYLNES